MSVQAIQTLVNTAKRAVIKAIRINDGAENDTALVIGDASALVGAGTVGNEKLTITKLYWSIGGPTANKTVTLLWDGDTNKEILSLSGNGTWNFAIQGLPPLSNDNTDVPTGDVLITTTNFAADDFYTIIIEYKKVSGYEFISSSSSSSSS